jgi:hypothetical protein
MGRTGNVSIISTSVRDSHELSIAVTTTAVGIPMLMSLSALLPYRAISRIANFLHQPLLGRHHRMPFLHAGTMPTRAQSLFFTYLLVVNIVLMCLPLRLLQPNARLPSTYQNMLQVIGDRAGVLAAANLVPLLLTSSRNNLLLWFTNWSHTTYLLVHRWLGYIVILQTVVHSVALLDYYLRYSDHAAESQLPYWYWGIISTLAICLILPFSVLPVRQQVYEIFLISHQILAALALVGYFLHIWYLFQYNWGYEIWVYIAGALWFLDRVLRIIRIARFGTCTAHITSIGNDSELLKIDIEGVYAEGHAYLYFPTLTWRFWENHPFSVLSSFEASTRTGNAPTVEASSESENSSTKEHDHEKLANTNTHPLKSTEQSSEQHQSGPRTSFLLRPRAGLTLRLLKAARTNGSLSRPVWIESSYHAEPTNQFAHCSTLICVAGGVGITAVLPVLKAFTGPEARLYWGVKHRDIMNALGDELEQLNKRGVGAEVKIGERWNVSRIVKEEVLNGAGGNVGVMVCGPSGMADEVRRAVGEVSGKAKRGVVFVDEAFSW